MIDYINLPFRVEALEPAISKKTIEYHYGKHLKNYVDTLNKLIVGTKYEDDCLEEIIHKSWQSLKSEQTIFNNAGQIFNHNFYFTQFSPYLTHNEPNDKSKIYQKIISQWGNIDSFKEDFVKAGVQLFGSGWIYLSLQPDNTLIVTQEIGASNPTLKNPAIKPLLTFDVWEHAYYLDYQNRRAEHLNALWNIVNWEKIDSLL